jgi:group II intron reverse transcriptase/maturase
MLGIPTAVDRVIQQAIAQVLTPIYEPEFVETSYGFRPGKSTHDAIRKCQEYLNEGYVWAVDMDLEKFFDTVNQSKLIEILPRKIKDGRVISLIHKYLRAGAVYCGKFEDTTIGVPQGGPLSPLCENIMLNELDHELKKRGHCYVRYADDMVILYRSKASAKQTLEHIIPYIERKLFLKVNQEKTVVAYAGKIKFLGYGFYKNQKGFQLRVHEKSKGKMKAKVKRLTGRRYVSDYEGFYIQMVWLNHPLPFGWTGSKPTVSLPHSLAALRIPFRYSVLILTSWTCYNSELRTDIPLILHFTSARRHDSVNFLVVFHELEKHMPAVSASNMCLDSAMDNSPTYRILKNRGIRAFIDLNHKCGQPKTFASGALSIKAYENGECVGQVRIPPSAGVNPEFLSEEQWGQVLEREGKLRAGK